MLRSAAVGLVLVLEASLASAQSAELPPRLDDLAGARSEAMGGAFRAIGTSNDALYLNPAGLGAAARYEVNAFGAFDLGRPGGDYGASILDSEDGPFFGGLAFTRFYQGPPGAWTVANDFRLSLALPIGPYFTIGVTGKWVYLSTLRRHNAVTPDLGALLHLEWVSVGLVAYNIISVRNPELPLQFAGAFALGPDMWKVAVDVVADTVSRPETSFDFQAGGEFLPVSFFAIRAGFDEDRIRLTRFVTGGVGFVFPIGFGLDLSYKHELEGVSPSRELFLTFRLMPFADTSSDSGGDYLDQ